MKSWIRLALKALRDRMHITHLEGELSQVREELSQMKFAVSRLELHLTSVGALVINEQKLLNDHLSQIETQVNLLQSDVADKKQS